MTAALLRRAWPVSLLVAVALALRLGYVVAYPQVQLQADSLDYDRLARSVLAGEGLVDLRGEPETLRPPLYPLFVAGIYHLGNPDATRVRIVQAALGALLPALVLGLGVSCFSPRVAWAAAAVCAVYPALIAYTGLVLTETCASLLVITGAISAVRAAGTGGLGWSATTGVALGLTALCRAELAALAGALCLARLVPPTHSVKKRLASTGVLLIAFLLTLLPWTLRNYRALGSFVPLTTDGWRTLWIASYPERWLEWKAAEPVLSIEAGAKGPLERSRRFRAAALDNLRSHPGAYAAMALRRLPLLFIGGHSNVIVGLQGTTADSRGLRRILKVGMLVLNTLLLAAAGVGLWLCRTRWITLLPLYVTLFVPSIVYLLLFSVPRYHIPLLPIVFLFAAEATTRVPFGHGASPPNRLTDDAHPIA